MTMTHKMRLVQAVLLLGALQGFLSQVIQVFQSPEILHAYVGSNVTLLCTYNISGVKEEATIGSYMWRRHLVKMGPVVSNDNEGFTGRISRVDTESFIKTRSAHITIHNVVSSDTGIYFCEVTFLNRISVGISGHGAGTLLNVTGDMTDQLGTDPEILHITLGAVFGVVVVLLFLVGCYRIFKQALRSTVEEVPTVYTEFIAMGSRQIGGPRGPEMLQNVETSQFMMENQQYNQFMPEQFPQKTVPSIYQEVDIYSIIP
ncbi:natural cytotoxicity triggering receptor 3-like isoform X2 [Hyla sarda]|uniref:natural cytotoxicity triggering receptor 3-like isoform X2 n=1 Tax=Hyla sarda TaxID=327740 RepID=UPI0024C3473F|nr:natural cytotoxicity triggering receptor 3-like isoform X2 [Hyla sarda]